MAEIAGLQAKIDLAGEWAIAAAMADQGFHGTCAEGFQGLRAGPAGLGPDPVSDTVTISYPDGDVRIWGLGQASEPELTAMALEIYRSWPAAVEEAFAQLRDVPEPDDFDDVLLTLAECAAGVSPGGAGTPAGGQAVPVGNLDLHSYLTNAEAAVVDASSVAIRELATTHVNRVRPVLVGQHEMLCYLVFSVLAEQSIWTAARIDIPAVADAAAEAFRARAERRPDLSSLAVPLGVGSAVVGLGSLAGGPIGAMVAVLAAGLSVASTLAGATAQDAETPPLGGASADAVLGNLHAALDELNRVLRTEEMTIVDGATALFRTVDANIDAYDLGTQGDFLAYGQGAPEVDELDLNYERLTSAAAELTAIGNMVSAVANASHADAPSAWVRSAGVGVGPSGPRPAWLAVQTTAVNLMTRTAGELDAIGAQILRIVSEFSLLDAEIELTLQEGVRDLVDPTTNDDVRFGYDERV